MYVPEFRNLKVKIGNVRGGDLQVLPVRPADSQWRLAACPHGGVFRVTQHLVSSTSCAASLQIDCRAEIVIPWSAYPVGERGRGPCAVWRYDLGTPLISSGGPHEAVRPVNAIGAFTHRHYNPCGNTRPAAVSCVSQGKRPKSDRRRPGCAVPKRSSVEARLSGHRLA
jgi:hypothetical protein